MKYAKLGTKASIFHDPTNGLKVLPGQVVMLDGDKKFSKKTDQALKGGHLEYATEDEYKEYTSSQEKLESNTQVLSSKKMDNTDEDEGFDVETFDDYSEEGLKALTNDQLKELAVYNETELEAKVLKGMNKAQLVEEVLSLLDDEEE